MKFREILRFEFIYQGRRLSTWIYFAVLFLFAFGLMRIFRPNDAVFFNAPSVIAFATIFGGVIWLLAGGATAGEAAARDVQTGMHPLTYTAPISALEYLGGRFAAAFLLNALILLALPLGMLLGLYTRGLDGALLAPFRPATYVTAYCFILLPNAFVVTAVQFAFAALDRRGIASYLASVLLLVTSHFVAVTVAQLLDWWDLRELLDLVGFAQAARMETWSQVESNTRLLRLEGWLLASRLTWLGIAVAALTFTLVRFKFRHHTARSWWGRFRRRPVSSARGEGRESPAAFSVPAVARTFGAATCARQTRAVAAASFRTIARSRTGIALVAAIAIGSSLLASEWMTFMDAIPLLPRAAEVLAFLAPPLSNIRTVWIIIPLLIVFYAGELVWRERDAGVSEIADTTPVPEWILLLGKFLGLALIILVWLVLLLAAAVIVQLVLEHTNLEIWPYVQVLFGLQFVDYLLFALLVLVVHVIADQKYLGHLVAFAAYGFIAFASRLGIEHNLLVYGADPGWSYTDMSGFGASLGPWLWFKVYWTAWALFLALLARLLWPRGRERNFRSRLQQARRRLTLPASAVFAAATLLIAGIGGFIFYNTNVLNRYHSGAERMNRAAEYERRYGRYKGIPQPQLTATELRVEIYPSRRTAEIHGTYRLVNNTESPIDAIHVATAPAVETGPVALDRPSSQQPAADDLGHRIYALERPLQPGDSVRLDFAVYFRPRGFRNGGIDASVVGNGTYFTNLTWLPAIGYQAGRELTAATDRRLHGLPPRPEVPSLYDAEARRGRPNGGRIDFAAIVGTEEGQVAVAPGALRRTWTESGRRYFHYATDVPIGNEYALFSAEYAVHEGRWNGVSIQVFHHPGHTELLERMIRSVQAALSYYTTEFGPTPHRHVRIVEHPGGGRGMHADGNMIDYQEGYSLLNPRIDRGDPDLPFQILAHEVAHLWWGGQLPYASVEGAGLLIESVATYSAMQVLEQTFGAEHLARYLRLVRAQYEVPRSRAAPPLLRAADGFLSYRKGPLALYALGEYIGKGRVHEGLRRVLEKHGSGRPPLPTSLDLYRELQAVTPALHQSLLRDLFEANTYWELETEGATATENADGSWEVTLAVRTRKAVIDEDGTERELPMNDWIPVGIFTAAEQGQRSGRPVYLQMHRLHAGRQTITVTLPQLAGSGAADPGASPLANGGKPSRAGLDPQQLLIDLDPEDNTTTVKIVNGGR